MTPEGFVISEKSSLYDALSAIEKNRHGVIFVNAANGVITGIATDGDIRRALISGRSLTDPILTCANKNFISASPDATREKLIKKLNDRIRVVPIIDEAGRLVSIITSKQFPAKIEEPIYARAKSPVRVSFGGGGTDLSQYFSENKGAVINTTIAMHCHSTLRMRNDKEVHIWSKDLGRRIEAESLAKLTDGEPDFALIKATLDVLAPDFGFELFLHSDFPMGSGLGGSAAVVSSIIGCFNQFRRDQWSLYEIAEMAYQAERITLGISGGWQDQYATVFGGFNFMEFQQEKNIVHPLRIHPDVLNELAESLVLCSTQQSHNSHQIHSEQAKTLNLTGVKELYSKQLELCYTMRDDLLLGNLMVFGKALDKAWQLKRQFAAVISNKHFDDIYDGAKQHGALGGKLLGAGAGGFFLFYVPPVCKLNLLEYLEKTCGPVQSIQFQETGLEAWKRREY